MCGMLNRRCHTTAVVLCFTIVAASLWVNGGTAIRVGAPHPPVEESADVVIDYNDLIQEADSDKTEVKAKDEFSDCVLKLGYFSSPTKWYTYAEILIVDKEVCDDYINEVDISLDKLNEGLYSLKRDEDAKLCALDHSAASGVFKTLIGGAFWRQLMGTELGIDKEESIVLEPEGGGEQRRTRVMRLRLDPFEFLGRFPAKIKDEENVSKPETSFATGGSFISLIGANGADTRTVKVKIEDSLKRSCWMAGRQVWSIPHHGGIEVEYFEKNGGNETKLRNAVLDTDFMEKFMAFVTSPTTVKSSTEAACTYHPLGDQKFKDALYAKPEIKHALAACNKQKSHSLLSPRSPTSGEQATSPKKKKNRLLNFLTPKREDEKEKADKKLQKQLAHDEEKRQKEESERLKKENTRQLRLLKKQQDTGPSSRPDAVDTMAKGGKAAKKGLGKGVKAVASLPGKFGRFMFKRSVTP